MRITAPGMVHKAGVRGRTRAPRTRTAVEITEERQKRTKTWGGREFMAWREWRGIRVLLEGVDNEAFINVIFIKLSYQKAGLQPYKA